MAIEGIQILWSFPAGAALTQYTWVKLNASGQAVPCTAVTDRPVGIVQDNPAAGETATVCGAGISKLVTGAAGALAIGQTVGTDASSQGSAVIPGTNTTQYLLGTVIEASANSGELCSVWINCPSAGRAA